MPATLLLVALFLRTYDLHIVAWNPDTYEQLAATKRLLEGDLPISRGYPPGVAIVMAAPMLLLPRTLDTMQAFIVFSSVALVALAYYGTKRTTGDQRAASFFGLAVAAMPLFVYYSRVALFDVVGTLAIAVAVFSTAGLRARGIASHIAYGLLLALIINIRPTNAVVLPGLLLYYAEVGEPGIGGRAIKRAILSRNVLSAMSATLTLSFICVLAGGWLRHQSSTPIGFESFIPHALTYLAVSFGGRIGMVAIAPFAIAGTRVLWRSHRSLTLLAGYVIVAWILTYSVFPFFEDRYMAPALFFALFLSAHGASGIFSRTGNHQNLKRVGFSVLIVLAAYVALWDGLVLHGWASWAERSDEAVYRELRPVVASLDGGVLLVTSQAAGLQESNTRIDYLDLLDEYVSEGNGDIGVQDVITSIEEAQAKGQPVYYLYSDFEAAQNNLGWGGPGFERYFDAVERQFEITETYRASFQDFRIYRVGNEKATGATNAPTNSEVTVE